MEAAGPISADHEATAYASCPGSDEGRGLLFMVSPRKQPDC